MEVTEFLIFENSGDMTFVGKASDSQAGQTLRFSLPQDASEIAMHSGVTSEQTVSFNGGFVSLAPVFPGTNNVVYSYLLPIDDGQVRLVRALDYPTEQVVLLIGGGEGTLTGPEVFSRGPITIEGTVYQSYGASLPPGASALEVTASGWTGASGNGSAGGNYAPALAGAVAGGGLMGVLAYALLSRRRNPAPVEAGGAQCQAEEQEDLDDELG